MGNLMKNGVSYTGSMLGGSTKTFKGILEAGETSISFVDTLITGNSTIDYETSKLGVNPTNIEVANNAVTLTFAAQAEDIGIRVTISNDAAEPAPTKMRFLKATGAQKITLPVYVDEGLEIDFYADFSSAHLEEAAIYDDSTWSTSGYILHTFTSDNELYGLWRPGENRFKIPKDRICHFHITDTQLICNETVLTKSNISVNHDPLHLFSRYNGTHRIYASFSRMKISKLGNLVMDLLPTKIGGEACYYDLVGKKAYFSETSTPFELEELEYTPLKKPEFIVEYEMTNASTSTDTFTVVNEGLYFLAAVNSYKARYLPSITINSAQGQIWNQNSKSAISAYCFATLYSGDTVTFSGGGVSNRGNLYQAIRITNCSFNSLVSYNSTTERHNFTYDILNISEPTFIYYGNSGASSAWDNSNINASVCNTYTKRSTDGKANCRIVTCSQASNGGTITCHSADYDCDIFVNAQLDLLN